MSFAGIVLDVVKIALVIAFLMAMAAVSVWADRRQGGLIQDRIGPTRAVAFLPRWLVQGLLIGGAIALSALVVLAPAHLGPSPNEPAALLDFALRRTLVNIELGVLVLWLSLVVLAARVRGAEPTNAFEQALGRLDPRAYFYGGLVLHILGFVIMRVLPLGWYGAALTASNALLVVAIGGSAGYVALFSLTERRVAVRLQGLLHPVADTLKMIWKEDLRPAESDRLLFGLAPTIAMFPALVAFAVIPFGSTLCFRDGGTRGALDWGDLAQLASAVDRSGVCRPDQIAVPLQVADLNVGLLYIVAVAGVGIIGAALAGWASNNKLALLGGLRATSQMVSTQITLGLSIVGLLLVCASAHMLEIVDWQGAHAWGIFVQPLGFVLFLTAMACATKRVPFDQPEGDSEIVAGYMLEYSGTRFGIFVLGKHIELVLSSALVVTLFLGGYHLPFLHAGGFDVAFGGQSLFKMPLSHLTVSAIHLVTFFVKVLVVLWLHAFVRWTLPRFRYDQVMHLGWKRLLPLSLANILLTGVIVLALDGAGPSVQGILGWASDISHAVVALALLVAAVALASWLLEPPERRRFLRSSSARFAAAAGGAKMGKTGR